MELVYSNHNEIWNRNKFLNMKATLIMKNGVYVKVMTTPPGWKCQPNVFKPQVQRRWGYIVHALSDFLSENRTFITFYSWTTDYSHLIFSMQPRLVVLFHAYRFRSCWTTTSNCRESLFINYQGVNLIVFNDLKKLSKWISLHPLKLICM